MIYSYCVGFFIIVIVTLNWGHIYEELKCDHQFQEKAFSLITRQTLTNKQRTISYVCHQPILFELKRQDHYQIRSFRKKIELSLPGKLYAK